MESTGIIIGFWALSALTVGASLLVFLARNLIHAVVLLVLAFMGMAGLFVTLSADFIAIAQILIYAGAIAVLMVFAIMLTPLAGRDNGNSIFVGPGVLLGAVFAALVVFVAVDVDWPELTGGALDARSFNTTAGAVGDALLNRYVLAFEIASVLLLAAFIGAIALVQEEGES